jgi:hypothetical protein
MNDEGLADAAAANPFRLPGFTQGSVLAERHRLLNVPSAVLHLHKPFGVQLSTCAVAGFVASCRMRAKFRRISVPVA